MAKTAKIMVTALTLVVFGAIFASSASAFGQCGGSVSTGSELFHEWQAMGVTSQAGEIAKSAGFHRMDGSLSHWMNERVVKAKLASTASPEDFGCNPGTVFSVGPRAIAKGTPVMVVLPLKFAKGDVRFTPHKGFKRVVVSVRVVGKTDCSNPLKGTVRVVIYVKVVKHHPHHPKCKCHKKPPPKPKPSCEAQGLVTVAGNCVSQSNNAEQNCKATVNGQWNGSQCTIVQINANCSNVAANEGGTVVQGGNCNTIIVVEEKPCANCETPVMHWTQISCTGFEEVFGSAGLTIDCAVSDDNGAQISLDAHSNDTNTQVSGINCFSNGGSQTCPSGGTFEFLVSGNNNGSTVLWSSVTATASANGVKAPFVSDPFKVDPSGGGF